MDDKTVELIVKLHANIQQCVDRKKQLYWQICNSHTCQFDKEVSIIYYPDKSTEPVEVQLTHEECAVVAQAINAYYKKQIEDMAAQYRSL